MRYLVTNNDTIVAKASYSIITVEEALAILYSSKIWSVDTETEGFDPHTKKLLTVQIGNFDTQICIDVSTVDIKLFKPFLESIDVLFLFHNAKFDLKFLIHQGIFPKNIYDTYLVEKLIYLGYLPGQPLLSLAALGKRYCDVELDKSVRDVITKEGLSERVIVYSCEDVKYLHNIREQQLKVITQREMLRAIDIEHKFVRCLAYLEYCGVKLDKAKWTKKVDKIQAAYTIALEKLNTWVIDNAPKYTYVNRQGDLFEGFDLTPKCTINWNSSKQIIPLFEDLGLNLIVKDKKTKKEKKSIEAKVISPQAHLSTIIPLYLNVTKLAKELSTYGYEFLNWVNPTTDRIHANFNQLMDTSRLSSDEPNMQNLPANEETRSCFVAEEGNSMCSCDFSGQESVILTNRSMDEKLIEFFRSDGSDLHSYVAKLTFPKEIGDTPIGEIKAKFPKLRSIAKQVEFAVAYGGDGYTIATNIGCSPEEGRRIYEAYLNAFPGLKAYFKYIKNRVLKDGYIILCKETGHRTNIYDYHLWKTYDSTRLNGRRHTSEKQALNYPIQGTGSVMTKLAFIKFMNYIETNNLLHIVKLVVPVHDEIVIEYPEKMTSIPDVLKRCMVDAGNMFCKIIPMDAEYSVGKHWIH